MREITLPEVKLPDIKLPDGFREMSRDDIVNAAKDVRLPKMELPKRLEMPDIDLSKVDLPKPIADRLPGRKRRNPIFPIAGMLAIGALLAGIWYLVTSPVTGPRVKSAFYDLRSRVTGQRTDMIRYDDDLDLGSLVREDGTSHAGSTFSGGSTLSESTPTSDLTSGMPVGAGESLDAKPESLRTPTY
jgi:hypothetical protein